MAVINGRAKKIKVTINGSDIFQAWSFGDRWNGFVVPYFEKDEADKVANVHDCHYESRKDIYESYDGIDSNSFGGLMIETDEGPKRVYAIGSMVWAWEDKIA